jgi:hypothetical protein
MLNRLMAWKKKTNPKDGSSRKVCRFPVHAQVSLVLENGAVIAGILKDMGKSGVFVITSERPFGLTVGEEGDLGLASQDGTPDSEYRFPCKVVRIDSEGIGLQFLVAADGEGGSYYSEGFLAQ